MTMKSCIECGEISEEARCPEHRGLVGDKGSTTERGYGWHWQQVSQRARRAQPWCSDCGATSDLTTDHSEEAWRRHLAGKPIRLRDVEVLCRSCNGKRGRTRPA